MMRSHTTTEFSGCVQAWQAESQQAAQPPFVVDAQRQTYVERIGIVGHHVHKELLGVPVEERSQVWSSETGG